jgi:hypothetical protein
MMLLSDATFVTVLTGRYSPFLGAPNVRGCRNSCGERHGQRQERRRDQQRYAPAHICRVPLSHPPCSYRSTALEYPSATSLYRGPSFPPYAPQQKQNRLTSPPLAAEGVAGCATGSARLS